MNKKITDLYEDYKKGLTNRRDFIRKLAMFAGSTAAALALLSVSCSRCSLPAWRDTR
jgi:hypothetical protein